MKHTLGGILLIASTFGTNCTADSLIEVYKQSFTHDSAWTATIKEYYASKEATKTGRAELLPTFNAEGSSTRNHNHLKGVVDQHFNTLSAGATLTQPILTLSGHSIYKQSKAIANRTDSQFASDLQDFIIKVSEAYFGELRAEDSLRFANAVQEAIAQQLAQAKERFDVGLIPITDVYEAQSAHDLAHVDVIVAQNNLAIAKENLETLTGEHHSIVLPLSSQFPIKPPQPMEIANWEQKAISQNFDIMLANFDKQAAKSEVKIQRHARTPELDAFANYSYTDSDQINNVLGNVQALPPTEQITYGLRMNWQIYQGGAIRSRAREASYRYEASKDVYENARTLAIQETRNLYRTILADVSTVSARKQGIRSASSALEATNAGYEVGTRNIVDVLGAQQALFAAKRDYANARYDYILNTLRLSALTGELTETSLITLDRWLIRGDTPQITPSNTSNGSIHQ